MSYEVVWRQRAFDQLAGLLAAAPADHGRLAVAWRQVGEELADDPTVAGESRAGAVRVMFVYPLTVYFRPVPAERAVYVLEVHRPG